MLSSIKTHDGRYTVIVNNKSYTFASDHPSYLELLEAIAEGDAEKFTDNMDSGQKIADWSKGNFDFSGGVLTRKGVEVAEVITQRIIDMIAEGLPPDPMLNFLDRLYQNPSNRAVSELYNFLVHEGLPITADGKFRAYKYVSVYSGRPITDKMGRKINEGDFVDTHTRKSYRNNEGDLVEMERNQVNENPNETCSYGLHVGAHGYSAGRGNVMLVEVDPADVVSVPVDYNGQKLRCCRYEVVGKYEGMMNSTVVPQDEPYSRYEDEDDYDEDYDDDDDYGFDFDDDYDDDDYL